MNCGLIPHKMTHSTHTNLTNGQPFREPDSKSVCERLKTTSRDARSRLPNPQRAPCDECWFLAVLLRDFEFINVSELIGKEITTTWPTHENHGCPNCLALAGPGCLPALLCRDPSGSHSARIQFATVSLALRSGIPSLQGPHENVRSDLRGCLGRWQGVHARRLVGCTTVHTSETLPVMHISLNLVASLFTLISAHRSCFFLFDNSSTER